MSQDNFLTSVVVVLKNLTPLTDILSADAIRRYGGRVGEADLGLANERRPILARCGKTL